MDLQFFGANCMTVNCRGVRLVVDDTLAELGGKQVSKPDDVLLFTGQHAAATGRLVLDSPGEYEVSDVSIIGTPARAHMDEPGKKTITMFKVMSGELSLLFTGHIYPELDDEQLERVGLVDVLVIPVGGSGYTLDPIGAQKIIKAVEPKLVIPTHYNEKGLNYPVPQLALADALKELGLEQTDEKVAKLKLKPSDLPELTKLAVLERS